MLKARFSTTAIVVAFILIASFAAVLFPQAISPQPALAETVQTVFNSNTTWTVPSGVTSVQVLVVAGGGGGGGASILDYAGGGGGAGGLVYNSSYSVTPGTNISVTVGSGGSGGSGSNGNQGTNGGNSVFGSITAIGGGYGGGGWAISGYCTGGDGGSGGGGGVRMGYYSGGSGTAGQGHDGGDGTYPCCWVLVCTCPQNNAGGGGGGAGAAGAKASSGQGGSGGVGLDYSATFGTGVGASGWFAGGGGGGAPLTGGSGGTGGGGNGGGNANGASATANTGGGGGGGGAYSATIRNGGNGGSGVVIVKYTVPDVGTISLWTTGGSPSETTSMTPQLEYNIKVPVTDDDTLDDLSNLKVTLYYDSDGSYSEGEVPSSGNTQTAAILTWTNAEPNTWTIDPSSSTTWSINSTSSVEPTLSNDTGTFEFHFTPGKVATETTGSAKWHIYVKATNSAANTGTGTKQNLTMNWYGEIAVNTGSVDWGTLTAGMDFAEGDPSEETSISVTYISNGAYNQQVKSSTSWTGIPSGTATLNTSGAPDANEFSLKADDDGTLDAAVTVSDSYQTFDTGTITSESGNAEAGNSLWLKLGTPFTKATYSGTIYFQISDG